MKTNVCLAATLRQPFRSLLLLILFGLITFGFMTKAVEFILIQRETEVLGSYYRSIGVLENIADPQSGDISAGIDLIETSPYFAYGDQREIVSGVMAQTYNQNWYFSNSSRFIMRFPEEQWPNVYMTDMWFIGELTEKEAITIEIGGTDPLLEAQTGKDSDETEEETARVVGYYLEFYIDTLFAAYPIYATEDRTINLKFLFEGHESAIPLIDEMAVGQRYLIRGWEDVGGQTFDINDNHYEIKLLDDGQLWYIPLKEEESIDFSDPAFASIKNKIDILNENLHTLGIITTVDMSAMPQIQEASRDYNLTEGRWLNYQDYLDGNKVIVVPEEFARLQDLQLGDKLHLTFRPLTDTYYGLIRDGVDSENWRNYSTYQDAFEIIGVYARAIGFAYYAYIPTNSLPPGFISKTQDQFKSELDYNFVLDSTRYESEFVQAYKDPLQEMGIRLTILENNGETYWASVDPIRRSLSADLLVFGLLMGVAFMLAVFLYRMQRKRDYAILRALGVPTKQANAQLVRPLLLLGGIGIIAGGLPAWNYALDQARAILSTLPTPGGVSPSAELSPLILLGLSAASFLLLVLLSLLSAFFLARTPVFELLQGSAAQFTGKQNQAQTRETSQPPLPISSNLASPVDEDESRQLKPAVRLASLAVRRKYTPASLRQFVLHHILRSRLKSLLTLAIALGFVLAAGWVRQTMESSRLEVELLYDTTEVEADVFLTSTSTGETDSIEMGFVYQKTINSILDSSFVESSVLEADTTWFKIERPDADKKFPGIYSVYAFDSPETFYSGLGNPDSLSFAPEWDLERFAKAWTPGEIQSEGVPALFPIGLLKQLETNLGEQILITDRTRTYSCTVVGQYADGLETTNNFIKSQSLYSDGEYILIPLTALEAMEGGQTKYTVAHFVLDPVRNRELPQFRADMEEVMDVYAGKVRLVVWDEELRIVVAQLEKNISLLEVLYPVVIAVSVLIGAGLCFLLLLQATREAAILRVLGTTQTGVRLALISEPVILSLIGVAISLGIASFIWTRSGLVPIGTLLISAGLYLAGALAGAVAGAISVTNKKPLELLQVKE